MLQAWSCHPNLKTSITSLILTIKLPKLTIEHIKRFYRNKVSFFIVVVPSLRPCLHLGFYILSWKVLYWWLNLLNLSITLQLVILHTRVKSRMVPLYPNYLKVAVFSVLKTTSPNLDVIFKTLLALESGCSILHSKALVLRSLATTTSTLYSVRHLRAHPVYSATFWGPRLGW